MGLFKNIKDAFLGGSLTDENGNVASEGRFIVEEADISDELKVVLINLIKEKKKVVAIKVLRDSSPGTYLLEEAKLVIDELTKKIKNGLEIITEETIAKEPPEISKEVVDLIVNGEVVKAIKQLRYEGEGYHSLKEAKAVVDKLRYEIEHELIDIDSFKEFEVSTEGEVKVTREVIELVLDGKKTNAIKLLIEESGGTLTLKEAKTKVEEMEKYIKENYK